MKKSIGEIGLSSSVQNVLRRLQNSTLQTHARIDALRGVCKEVTDIRVKGIHTYFTKKILEMLILLALNRLTLSCHRSDTMSEKQWLLSQKQLERCDPAGSNALLAATGTARQNQLDMDRPVVQVLSS